MTFDLEFYDNHGLFLWSGVYRTTQFEAGDVDEIKAAVPDFLAEHGGTYPRAKTATARYAKPGDLLSSTLDFPNPHFKD